MTLDDMVQALEAAASSKRRDDCGDLCVKGKAGMVYYSKPTDGFYLYCDPGSARAWGFVKKAFDFCRLTQDGETDGFFFLDRLPTPEEAVIIRERLVIRKRRVLTDVERARLAADGAKHRFQPSGSA